MQMDIFDLMYKPFKITKPIKLIEFFGGYGSQALALKYLGVDFQHHKLCEWAVKSIQAYKDIHMTNDNTDYSKDLTSEEVKQYLYDKGISSNYNEPMSKEQVWRLNEELARKIYNNIQATHNLVNIQQVKGDMLDIINKDKYTYLLTYSFPCQDISNAGNKAGFEDTSTRSGMLWEVERILKECDNKPQILLMENVPQVHSIDNLKDFQKWITSLEDMGYKNYYQDLIATDYGIPQTRNRTFMVSVLGNYKYTFPEPIPLKLKLKDMLEKNVDEKYIISDSRLKYFMREGGKFPRLERFKVSLKQTNENNVAGTITTSEGNVATSNFININNKSLKETLEKNEIKDTCYIDTYNRRIDEEKSGTITTGVNFRNNTFLAIKNNTKKGYIETTDGDGIDLTQPNSKTRRGRVQKDSIQTLTTQNNLGVINNELRIRKLTPKECFRLMGVKDEDIDKIMKNQSNASAYHLAGDSICTSCLMAIFGNMLGIDWKEKVKELYK